ncbi:MAG: addiction module protein [Mucilaginibacter sp.]
MSLQYLSNEKGQVTAVLVPIEEWDVLKSKFPGLTTVDSDLPNWQKELIDTRLNAIKENPSRVLPIDSLIAELDHEQE